MFDQTDAVVGDGDNMTKGSSPAAAEISGSVGVAGIVQPQQQAAASGSAGSSKRLPSVKQRRKMKRSAQGECRPSVEAGRGSSADSDAAFCSEVARRSVARAALHLGIEGMDGEALDALGSVLLGYMESVGSTIATHVESSGRSSAHSNAYDALNSVDFCTAPAAEQMNSSPSALPASFSEQVPLPDDVRIKQLIEKGFGGSWEGLAKFLFGDDWFSIPLGGEEVAANGKSGYTTAAGGTLKNSTTLQSNGKSSNGVLPKKTPGGKAFLPKKPNSNDMPISNTVTTSGKGKQLPEAKSVAFNRQDSITPGGGADIAAPTGGTTDGVRRWNAPYLGNIKPFPTVSNASQIANPHRLDGSSIPLSFHDLATEIEACRDPPNAKRQRTDLAKEKKEKAAARQEEEKDVEIRRKHKLPDEIFADRGTIWGVIDGRSSGAKRRASYARRSSSSIKSNVNVSEPTGDGGVGTYPYAGDDRPSYVPNFFPAFPSDRTTALVNERLAFKASSSVVMGNVMKRAMSREPTLPVVPPADVNGDAAQLEKQETCQRDSVRQALVNLGKKSVGQSYWGSHPFEEEGGGTEEGRPSSPSKMSTANRLTGIAVATGEGNTGTPSSSNKKGGGGGDANAAQVRTFARASGARVSKILEGSIS